MDAIASYKKSLKELYSKTDQESKDNAKELRKALEEAVGDLEIYQAELDKAKIPVEKLKNLKKEKDLTHKRIKAERENESITRDSAADRKAYKKAKRAMEEDDDDEDEENLAKIKEELEDMKEMDEAKAQLEKVESGAEVIPEST